MLKDLLKKLLKKKEVTPTPFPEQDVVIGPIEEEPGQIHHDDPIPVPTDPTITDK